MDMLKLKIFSIGKTKEPWLEDATTLYLQRLQAFMSVEFVCCKDDEQLRSLVEKEKAVLCLDRQGKNVSSEEFCDILYNALESGGSRCSLVIGGPEGLPEALRSRYPLLSFSKLTFTHQIARLILLEQIYRATEIRKGSKYHK